MTIVENIWVGVFTGVLTALLLFLVGRLWIHWLLPWLKEIRYQGVLVEGIWHAALKNGAGEPDTTVELDLQQSTQVLSGTMVINNKVPGAEWILTMIVHGRLWEGYVSMTLTPRDRKVTSVATGLLKVHGGGVSLNGILCLRNVNEENVKAEDLILYRKQ